MAHLLYKQPRNYQMPPPEVQQPQRYRLLGYWSLEQQCAILTPTCMLHVGETPPQMFINVTCTYYYFACDIKGTVRLRPVHKLFYPVPCCICHSDHAISAEAVSRNH